MRGALARLGPKYVAYVLSFLVIGRFWLAHHLAFGRGVRPLRRRGTVLFGFTLVRILVVRLARAERADRVSDS